MKNYYKILGLKKNASEEEIRERWVELMRKLHPDHRMEEAVKDERVKEINEAYQVLKHSSTRIEYDLKRAYDRQKRTSYVRKASIPIIILAVFIIVITLYLKKPQDTIQTALFSQNQTTQIGHSNDLNDQNELNVPNEIDQIDQINKRDQMDQRTQIAKGKDIDKRDQVDQRNQRNERSQIDRTDRKETTTPGPKDLKTSVSSKTQMSRGRKGAIIHSTARQSNGPIDSKPQLVRRSDALNQINLSREMRSLFHWDQKDQTDQITQIGAKDAMTPRPDGASTHDPIDASTHQPILAFTHRRIDASTHPIIHTSTHSRIDASARLIATEEEVKQFLDNYIDRYTQKDLDGFISLFCQGAVQNRQDGLERIRNVYANFFNLSKEIQYHMDDVKTEIYQNGVEIKARYELVHTLRKIGEKKLWRGDIRWTLVKEHGTLKILSLDYQHQKSP